MVELWFGLLCFMLTMFVVLDGWDIGAGALHLIVAKTAAERREVIAAIGPLWSWHEVWLVAAGGTFLLAFPGVMAASFSGFYLALWMALWSLILRGVSIEVGGHIPDRLWQAWWDFVFAASSLFLALLFGAAFGNVIRGVPIDVTGTFSMSLFTDFGVRGRVGILDWYTVSVAVFATLLLAAHGATYLRLKTTARVHDRSERLARRLWTGFRERAEARTFAGSCAIVAGLLDGFAAAVFPVMLHSTLDASYSLTAYRGAAAGGGLRIALVWWPLAFALAIAYLVIVLRSYRGRVTS